MEIQGQVFMIFWRVCQKDLRILLRDRSALIFIFALPLAFVFMFGMMFGKSDDKDAKPSPLKILMVNADAGKRGAELQTQMKTVGLQTETAPNAAALEARVKKGDSAVGIEIPADFSANLEAAARDAAAPQARIKLITDPAQSQAAQMAQGMTGAALQRVTGEIMRTAAQEKIPAEFREMAAQSMTAPNRSPVALEVATMQKPRTRTLSAGDLFIPGFMVYFGFFMANSVAVTLLNERQEGTLRRMLSAPVGKGQILFGKLLARGILGLAQTLLLLGVGKLFLHLSTGHAPLGLALTVVATIFTATGLGLLIASLGKTAEQIQGMTTFALLLMGLLSGCFWPSWLMPAAMQNLSRITPHAWALRAYQDLLLRDSTLLATLPNLLVLLTFGLAFYLLALTRFRYE